jgi:4-carboxymuconolactone decarboxylase
MVARVPEARGESEVASRIRARRPGHVLRPIDLALLHSAPVADGWNTFLGALRAGTSLRPDLREIVVLRVAVLNDAPYEWQSHERDAAEAGLSPAQLLALRADTPPAENFDAEQRKVIALTDQMTRSITVSDALAEPLKQVLGTTQFVELVTTVAAYNMVSRLVVALEIEQPDTTTEAVQ